MLKMLENMIIGYGEGVVTAGEVAQTLFCPSPNEALIEQFKSLVKEGKINKRQVADIIEYLKRKAQSYLDFIQQLELENSETVKVL